VAVALLTVVALVTGATAVVGWRLVDGIRSASSDSLPLPVDAVVVFAGEAAAFGALATERGWERVVPVTGDYHAQRASMLLSRC